MVSHGHWLRIQNIGPNDAMHTYTLTVNVTLDLTDGQGDDVFTPCGEGGERPGAEGEGLYNQALIDVDDDGRMDDTSDVCDNLTDITVTKRSSTPVQVGARSWCVDYTIVVTNNGGQAGEYDLWDDPNFDDDVVINSAQYTSDVPGNMGPVVLGNPTWTLATDQAIGAGESDTYTLTVCVTMDLNDPNTPGNGNYLACSSGNPGDSDPSRGLHNTVYLDTDNDGDPNDEDDACEDIPFVTHEKVFDRYEQTGPRSFNVFYVIRVMNRGGAEGQYTLRDIPNFDDDVQINSGSYTSSNPPGLNGALSTVNGATNTLTTNEAIASGATHVFNLTFNVTLDLMSGNTPGDGVYEECGENGSLDPQAGEGLFNATTLDVNGDGQVDEEDDACGDLPHIWHTKEVGSFEPMQNGNHRITYDVCVYNDGGAAGEYDLYDWPQFDDDIEIVNASFTSTVGAGGSLTPPPPLGGWLLNDNQTITENSSHCYTLEFEVNIDLSAGSGGNNVVRECGELSGGVPQPGDALFNRSLLDLDDDGNPDEEKDACKDVATITHEKTIMSLTQNPDDSWCIVYNIRVANNTDETGFYNLWDEPRFDDDFVILSAEYSSSIHTLTTLDETLPGGRWTLAEDVGLASYGVHIYTLKVCVIMDLKDPNTPGDRDYTACGEGTNGRPAPGQGLYNRSLLDTNDDGNADEIDEVCDDIPYVTHIKEFVGYDYDENSRTYDVYFKVTVDNIGGADGQYDLWDQPSFDDDFVILSAEYFTVDAPGNAGNPGPLSLAGTGPWTLAEDQSIVTAGRHCYNMTVEVEINLSDPDTPGDEIYVWCGQGNGGDPVAGEGLYNETWLDRSNDGNPEENEEACGDIEIIDLALTKELVTPPPYAYNQVVDFDIEVTNQGNMDMYEIVVNDYLPAGYAFAGVPGNDPKWSQVNATTLEYVSIDGAIGAASFNSHTIEVENRTNRWRREGLDQLCRG